MRTFTVEDNEIDEFLTIVGKDSKFGNRLLRTNNYCFNTDNNYKYYPVPDNWVLVFRDASEHHISGIGRWVPPEDPAINAVIGQKGHEGVPMYQNDNYEKKCHLGSSVRDNTYQSSFYTIMDKAIAHSGINLFYSGVNYSHLSPILITGSKSTPMSSFLREYNPKEILKSYSIDTIGNQQK